MKYHTQIRLTMHKIQLFKLISWVSDARNWKLIALLKAVINCKIKNMQKYQPFPSVLLRMAFIYCFSAS